MSKSSVYKTTNMYIIPDGIICECENIIKNKSLESKNYLEPDDDMLYTFIADNNSYNNVRLLEKIQSNDVYEKYKVSANVKGELICCKDKSKLKNFKNKIAYETYEEYLNSISEHDFGKEKWIYNIIDGISEQESILYSDEMFIIIPSYTWVNNINSIDNLHILAIFKDKNLRTIRDLDSSHIELLEKIKTIGLNIINIEYGLEIDQINIYFHYEPSTYQLHLHFTNLSNRNFRNSVESSHHIDNVIFNLSINSDYYKIIKMVKLS